MPEDVHDLLVIPKDKNLYQFQADASGGYTTPARTLKYVDKSYRKVMNIAQLNGTESPRGPAFSVLPNKPDPSTSQICCYLINSENLRAANPWTSDPWSSEPTGRPGLDLQPSALDGEPVDLLVAMANGKVLRVEANRAPYEIDLRNESEIYTQLRNGLVAGTVYCKRAQKVLPIVNVTSLFTE